MAGLMLTCCRGKRRNGKRKREMKNWRKKRTEKRD
jgi:hypothetical protein